ncbi:acyl-CoA dehydrogenase family protein [Ottowia thiooxydans]|uniref:Alkylation response protein AidB-like acyl-CoA dehydrogenase n=1 Tax=Ottowia thiooxydans TaxID=219182 RepID=A0ABV2QBE1_9BURK
MAILDKAGELQFRSEVRKFLSESLSPQLRNKVLEHALLTKEDLVGWQKTLNAQGWLAPGWPASLGGTGWTPQQVYMFEEECWLAGAPEVFAFGPKMLAPVLMKHGSPEQKAFFLPRILSSEDWWCQGYSEPGSGSDLASLRTRGVIDGDELVIDGQKTWTTYAHYANRMFCLVRTDPVAKPQEGISFVLLDMDTPGITVRPLILLDGTHEVNEVFFDQVRVPLTNVVGELHHGWTYAKALLGHERFNAGKIGRSLRELALLKRLAAQPDMRGRSLLEDPRFAERIAAAEVDLLALERTTLRLIAAAQAGVGIGVEPSILKIRGTEIAQNLSALLVEALRPYQPGAESRDALGPLPPPAALLRQYLNWRKLSIYGGSNEVQRNIIAKFALGL